jgi:diguanylate cyclase (GGDEF)-like protein
MRNAARTVATFAVAGAATAVVIGAALAVDAVDRRAGEHAAVSRVLAELRGDANARNAAEWQAIAEGEVEDLDGERVDDLDSQIRRGLDELRRLGDVDEADALGAVYLGYDTAVALEFELLADGKIADAKAFDEEVVDPAFEEFEERIVTARAAADERETAGRRRASTARMMIGAVALTAGWALMAAFVRLRRRQAVSCADRERLEVEVESANALAEARTEEANHDALTGLPNRRYAMSHLEALLSRSGEGRREPDVMLVDLNLFKEINDTLGHPVGDEVLVLVARRFAEALDNGEFLARLGGDEFAVIVDSEEDHAAEQVAERLHDALVTVFRVDDLTLTVSASIGIAMCSDGCTAQDLLRHADVAMYSAKRSDVPTVRYAAVDDTNSREQLLLGSQVVEAFACDQIVAYYQPQISAATGEVAALEALARWRHPQLGVVGPDRLLPHVIQQRLTRRLTTRMLDVAIKQTAEWHRLGYEVAVAVNCTSNDVNDPAFFDDVARLLGTHSLSGHLLKLEIVEGQLAALSPVSTANMTALRSIGVRLSLDDFGTGYSSLSQLRSLPIDELKIDRSFVANLHREPFDQALVRSTIEFADLFGITVVAEGVETDEVLSALQALSVHLLQGYLIARPLPADEITVWMASRKNDAVTRRVAAAPSAVTPG